MARFIRTAQRTLISAASETLTNGSQNTNPIISFNPPIQTLRNLQTANPTNRLSQPTLTYHFISCRTLLTLNLPTLARLDDSVVIAFAWASTLWTPGMGTVMSGPSSRRLGLHGLGLRGLGQLVMIVQGNSI
ncbi:hypothetical protein V6N13_145033 [Hibiscus sabdariffa]|uniref:Uncharacterized protein n=2 Tax=Hibiscus sabdariffa TaxID=183260 RepID=A0ABR2FM72_9ROSI